MSAGCDECVREAGDLWIKVDCSFWIVLVTLAWGSGNVLWNCPLKCMGHFFLQPSFAVSCDCPPTEIQRIERSFEYLSRGFSDGVSLSSLYPYQLSYRIEFRGYFSIHPLVSLSLS